MLAAPVAPGCTHAALHFIENEEDIGFVANFSQLLQPLATEMVVAALALNGLDNNGADVDISFVDEITNLVLGLLFTLDHVGFALRFRQRKIYVRT